MADLGANAQDPNSGLDRDRENTRLPVVRGVRKNPKANLVRMVDSRRSDLRTAGSDRSGRGRDRAVPECSGDTARPRSRKRDALEIGRAMRSTCGSCDEKYVSDRGADNQLSVQGQRKGTACVQQDGGGKERLGLSGDEGRERSQELRYAGRRNRCAALPGCPGLNAPSLAKSSEVRFSGRGILWEKIVFQT